MPETKIIQGDCRTVLRSIRDETINCVVTSPPYWGLRDYGTASWSGGDPNCSHRAPDEAGQTNKPTSGQREHAGRFAGPTCHQCGAKRIDAQIGLEQSPAQYVQELVEVFREVRRVLKSDGTLWLNLGDSYNSSPPGNKNPMAKSGLHGAQTSAKYRARLEQTQQYGQEQRRLLPDLKPKDLVGIPWRVAFALQQDGWYLRQDIIWAKPNPMPEFVRDRCTKSHEYLFLLAKSEKYYFDAAAIEEPVAESQVGRKRADAVGGASHVERGQHSPGKVFVADKTTRNKRSVWNVTTAPYREAHFATFPPKLVEPCILAGCPPDGIVLDPFAGAGTTGLVAKSLNRHFVGIELKQEYAEMARRRIEPALAGLVEAAE